MRSYAVCGTNGGAGSGDGYLLYPYWLNGPIAAIPDTFIDEYDELRHEGYNTLRITGYYHLTPATPEYGTFDYARYCQRLLSVDGLSITGSVNGFGSVDIRQLYTSALPSPVWTQRAFCPTPYSITDRIAYNVNKGYACCEMDWYIMGFVGYSHDTDDNEEIVKKLTYSSLVNTLIDIDIPNQAQIWKMNRHWAQTGGGTGEVNSGLSSGTMTVRGITHSTMLRRLSILQPNGDGTLRATSEALSTADLPDKGSYVCGFDIGDTMPSAGGGLIVKQGVTAGNQGYMNARSYMYRGELGSNITFTSSTRGTGLVPFNVIGAMKCNQTQGGQYDRGVIVFGVPKGDPDFPSVEEYPQWT